MLQFRNAVKGSLREANAATELAKTIVHRKHLDDSVQLIGEILFAGENALEKLTAVRPAGSVVVDDWACLKTMVSSTLVLCDIVFKDVNNPLRALSTNLLSPS